MRRLSKILGNFTRFVSWGTYNLQIVTNIYQRHDHSNQALDGLSGGIGDAKTKHSRTCTELKGDIDDFISEYGIFADRVSNLETGAAATNRRLESLRDELTRYVALNPPWITS